ncbi:hypothetical protein MJ572_18250 [Escherichia coli]|nr:hypothetical protein MJ572_18250 [Escherichia coli]
MLGENVLVVDACSGQLVAPVIYVLILPTVRAARAVDDQDWRDAGLRCYLAARFAAFWSPLSIEEQENPQHRSKPG